MGQTKPASLLHGKRFFIVVFLFFEVVINQIDRVNLSIAAPAVAKHFHWDAATMGWVFAAYLWTYALFLIPVGWLSDRFGPRRVFAVAITVWSAAAMLTGAVTNLFTMILARLGLGMGECVSFPVSNKVVRQWVPASERGFATGLYHAGVFFSMALATPAVAWGVLRYGWRGSFIVFGSLGFVWLVLWLKWFHPPETCPWLPAEERKLILENREGLGKVEGVNTQAVRVGLFDALGELLRHKTMWGLFITQGCVNYMNYVFLAWLPTYLVEARGMHLMKAGIYTAIPYLIGGTLEACFGRLSDHLLSPEEVKKGRRRNQVALFMALTGAILLINLVDSSFAIMAIITVALTCNTTVLSLNFSLTNDLVQDPRVTGTANGVLLLGGVLLGLFAPVITGYLVRETGSFNTAFGISGALGLVGAILSLTMTRKPVHAPVQVATPPSPQLRTAVQGEEI